MQQRLLAGGAALPVELSTMLEDFAKDKDIVSYDSAKGVVKFKSDLTFESGSDKVSPAAAEALKSLSTILNTDAARDFDVIVAGHTDDVRIARSATREKHPTNWHLSAHRAISVLDIMTKDGIAPERLSVRGFGEYRPLEANKPNSQNRRVEIYIVPKGI
jgi:chemotaxis protein MotB